MTLDIGLYSYLTVCVAYTLLTGLLVLAWRNRPFSLPVVTASALTAIWGAVIGVGTLMPYPPVDWIQLSEIARNAAWCYLLLQLIASRVASGPGVLRSGRWRPIFGLAVLAASAVLLIIPSVWPEATQAVSFYSDLRFSTWLALAVSGLLLLEQIFRNSSRAERWHVKYLCLGLGIVFAYDFFMYAEALLFRNLDSVLWQARGFVVALTAPLVAVAIARNTQWQLDIQVSRHVVFHSVTLLAAGIYLTVMAGAGYFIRYLGGTWGGVLQISFFAASGVVLVILLFSGSLRAKTRVWLSKHFFSYKYDYRVEWLHFTQALSEAENKIPEQVISAIASLVDSPAGLLWLRDDDGRYECASRWNMPDPDARPDMRHLASWLEDSQWIIDLKEWRRAPDIYEDLQVPAELLDINRAWLLVPLLFRQHLQGILLIRESDLQHSLNWEDRDLLKLAGSQAASHLAQHQASQALIASQQFEAFNRLSAYVVHDLKNILAQQSLIISNAEKYKHNPEFVDDVIETVRNSVTRMRRLMAQMREGDRGSRQSVFDLNELIAEVVEQRQLDDPRPSFEPCPSPVQISANREQLATVFSHLIQNAQEATAKQGTIRVSLQPTRGFIEAVVEDTGSGMSPEFIRQRLFKPFDSTKGLVGMGIGAFESREVIRALGGDILVESTPGVGSTFRIVLPSIDDAMAAEGA